MSLRLDGGALLDLDRLTVERDGVTTALTAMEAKLLGWLLARQGRAASREEILTEVWGYKAGLETRAIDNAVKRLRVKLERDPANPVHLLTVFGVGYRLQVTPPDPPPARADGLIGRDADLDALAAKLRRAGLVVLTGPGGVGKTRLSRALAQAEGGLCVDLESARSRTDLVRLVAAALGVVLQGATPSAVSLQIGQALAARGDALLVLDNLEQLPEALEHVAPWAAAAPRARILVTSRVALGGAQTMALEPLGEEDGLALLRARTPPGWAEPEALIRRILGRLDGLPLAIELAAARARLLSPAELHARLERSLDLLSDRLGARPARQASLRAVIEWSWELLSSTEGRALAQLAVFRGGADLDSAEEILDLPAGTSPLDTIDALHAASLVVLERGPEGLGRVRLLDSVAAFVGDRLSPDERDRVEARHRDHYRARSRSWAAGVHGAHAIQCLDALGREAENLRAVVTRARPSDPDAAAEVGLALDALWTVRGPLSARRDLIQEALAPPPPDPRLCARLLLARAALRHLDRRYAEAEADVGAALALAGSDERLVSMARRAAGQARLLAGEHTLAVATLRQAATVADPTTRAAALAELFRAEWTAGALDDAERSAEAALRAAREGGARWTEAWVLERLGLLNAERDEMGLAKLRIEAAVSLWRSLGKWNLGPNVYHLAVLHQLCWSASGLHAALRGARPTCSPVYDLAASERLLREVVTEHGRAGQPLDRAAALSTLWGVLVRSGQLDEAERAVREAIERAEAGGAERFAAWFTCLFAIHRALQGDCDLARSLLNRACAASAFAAHVTGATLPVVVRAATALGAGDPPAAAALLASLAPGDGLPEGVRHGVVWSAAEVVLCASRGLQ